jgi:predicted DNA-binding transcriptional regulator AlpA
MTHYITEHEVAKITGRAVRTLRDDRFKGKGFPYVKLGRSVRYDEKEIIAIMEAGRVITTSFDIEPKGKEES